MSEHLPAASSRETPKPKDSVPSVELGKLVIQAAGEIVDAGLVDDPAPGRREALNQDQGQLAEAQGEVAGAQPVGRHPNYGKKLSPETRAKISEARRGENNPMYGRSHSDETRAKMSEAKRGENNPMYGRSPPDETRGKISEAMRGKKRSPETRAKMSEAQRGENHPMYGRSPSDETRAKMSEAQRGENNPMYGRSFSDETRAKMSEARRGEKHYRYDQSIDKIRLAIADYVQGASMAEASRSQGFTNSWLPAWRRRHPERFQTFYSEAVAAASLSITQRDIVAHALEIVAEANKDKKLSPETRAKMSEARRGENNPMYGRSHSDETRAKISEAMRGKKRSPETRAKMSEAMRGENHPVKASQAETEPLRQEPRSQEEKLIALLPRLGQIERQIVVRSWGLNGHTAQSVDEINQELFQGMPIWRPKVLGTRLAVQRLILGF